MSTWRSLGGLGAATAVVAVMQGCIVAGAGPGARAPGGIEAQPLAVHAGVVVRVLDSLGSPLPSRAGRTVRGAGSLSADDAIREIQEALDPHCLVEVLINPEGRVSAVRGPAPGELVEQGVRTFLVKVLNQSGTTARLHVQSAQGEPLPGALPEQVRDRWMEASFLDQPPLHPELSGLALEYRILTIGSRDAGRRSAILRFDVGQAPADLGYRSEVLLDFECIPAVPVTLHVRDEQDRPTIASFVVRDALGRIYPFPSKRLAPDFAFQPQVYRSDGEQLRLPDGRYTVTCRRGPEYIPETRELEVRGAPASFTFRLERWIDPAARGWWSGDHHIHAAGCKHYSDPTQGVEPADILRHTMGEDLKVGAVLTWGPCFDYQTRFFTGSVAQVSRLPYLLRYDVEVSGFGSHQSGHLVLLRLREPVYPGGDSIHHWPTLGLNTLRWAKRQGAICGPPHSGLGLFLSNEDLPSYEVPPFDGIGANEYIMNVTHMVPGPQGEQVPAVDFMSTMDTPPAFELNVWYHTLNCGFRTRIAGETDFPCIYGDRPGVGRTYVRLDGEVDYDAWCDGIRLGRAYVSDGFSHLMEYRVDDLDVGTRESELALEVPTTVAVTASVAARLTETEPGTVLPLWNIARARVPGSEDVAVECVVNGFPVARETIAADGDVHPVRFEIEIARSSWIALRILPSSHTNPIFVTVGGRPIRASRRSALWCQQSLEQCWSQKSRFYSAAEMGDAIAAYDHARAVYARILAECDQD